MNSIPNSRALRVSSERVMFDVGFTKRQMKSGPTRSAVRFGTIVCVAGFVAHGMAFMLIWLAEASTVAMPFAVVGLFLSLPTVILAGDPFANPFWAYLLPVALVLNAVLLSLVVWTFHKVKIVVDKRVYGLEESQQTHAEATSETAPSAASEASDA